MAKIYSQLEKAQLENTTSDTASLPKGMATYRTDLNVAKISNGTTMKEVVDADSSQVLSNKEVVTPLIPEVATPSNPAAGKHKVYFKSDGNMYRLNSAGVERPVGTGGGAGSIQWIEAANAPIQGLESFFRTFEYEAGLGQSLYAAIKVPASYVAGSPIKLLSQFVSADSSGNVLMQTVATLIRQGTDAISSTTNQRTSTNAAVSLSGGTVDIPQAVTFDLTSTIGQINAVAVSPGDIILVEFKRGTDTATSKARVPVFAGELTFTP